MTYDSRHDTLEHIYRVRSLMMDMVNDLFERMLHHDESKLLSEEKRIFDRVTPQLRELEYGSEEYKASLAEMGEALRHHYLWNRHHPEHFEGGINAMSLLDLVEMLCDWKAAGERHKDGSMSKSLEINAERFRISRQLQSILENTAEDMGWIERRHNKRRVA